MRRPTSPLIALLLVSLLLPLVPRIAMAESFHGLFDYKVIKEDRIKTQFGTKHAMDIQLGTKIRTKALEVFANELFNKTTADYVIFTFYIPGQTVGAGAWANAVSTHRSPVQVTITGTTFEEDRKIDSATKDNDTGSNGYVGKWKDVTIGYVVELFSDGGKVIIQKTYADGSVGKKELKHSRVRGKSKLEVQESDTGDFFVLTDEGELSVYDSMGFIATYKTIQFNKGILK